MDTIVERLTLGKVVEETMETNRRERLGKQQRRKAMDNDAFIQDMYGGQDWGSSSLMGEGNNPCMGIPRTPARHRSHSRIVHARAHERAHTGTYKHACAHMHTHIHTIIPLRGARCWIDGR